MYSFLLFIFVQLFTINSVVIKTFKAQTVWSSGLDKIQKMVFGPILCVTFNK